MLDEWVRSLSAVYRRVYPRGAVKQLTRDLGQAYARVHLERSVRTAPDADVARAFIDCESAHPSTLFKKSAAEVEAEEQFELTRWTGEISRARLPLIRAPTLLYTLGADPIDHDFQNRTFKAFIKNLRQLLALYILVQC